MNKLPNGQKSVCRKFNLFFSEEPLKYEMLKSFIADFNLNLSIFRVEQKIKIHCAFIASRILCIQSALIQDYLAINFNMNSGSRGR